MKKVVSLLVLISMLLCVIFPALAANEEAVDAANQLYAFGLFNGTGTDEHGNPNFELDRVPTRYEAVIMLIRLLGKEGEAKAGVWETPFTDVAEWARPYVGYAYEHGLTSGTSATTYGGGDAVSAAQYLTFLLRALGYDSEIDFRWDRAWELSDQIGLTDGRYHGSTTEFLRGDVAITSLHALNTKIKHSEVLLRDALSLNEQVSYDRVISPLSDSAVMIEKNNIVVRATGKEYVDASFAFKESRYTNLASSYTWDYFFYSEFPQYKNQLIQEINQGSINCKSYHGKTYIDDVGAIRFFRQYGIEFYRASKTYQYVAQEITTTTPALTTEPVDYTVDFPSLSESSVIYAQYDICSKTTERTYRMAKIEIKSSPYTNMITGYFLDKFFFEEFPDYEYEIKKEVNNGEINGISVNGAVYLEAVNMIQFFRQYSIEFYHPSANYSYMETGKQT